MLHVLDAGPLHLDRRVCSPLSRCHTSAVNPSFPGCLLHYVRQPLSQGSRTHEPFVHVMACRRCQQLSWLKGHLFTKKPIEQQNDTTDVTAVQWDWTDLRPSAARRSS